MRPTRRMIIAGGAVLALAAGGAGIANAVGGDSDENITGPAADRAAQAAVEAAGGGRATEVERNDEGGTGWEVEVLRAGGKQVEVHLNDRFERVGIAEEKDDEDRAGDRD